VRFYLAATGQSSGVTAGTTFTDARNWTLTFAGTGGGSVTITPDSGTVNAPVLCGGTGSTALSQTVTGTCSPNITTSANGATVTFSASGTGGSAFAGWSAQADLTPASGPGSCTGTNNPCSVVMGPGGRLTVTFDAVPPTTSIASTLNPSVYGDSVTFNATVTPASGPAISCGTVAFKDGGTTFATVNVVSGAASTSISTLSAIASPHSITADYTPAVGGCSFTGSTSSALSQVVNKKAASVTPNAASKTYGSADPPFTGTLSGFLAADAVTGTYSRTAGETVAGSPYTISATLSATGALGNYTITSNTANFTINPKAASVTPNAASKTYGDADPPAFTGTLSGFLAADAVTATYSRTAGETVAGSPYTISATLSPAGVLGNYTITYNTANFTINPKAASATPNAASKTYGDADPAFTGTLSGFLAADAVTATYSRTSGETVAGSPYSISAVLSPAGVLGNYTITYNTANFTINPKAASVTPNAASKTYGDADPAFTGSLSGFLAADSVTATYSRTSGETVAGSPYSISAVLSPAGVLGNYTITYNTANFTISKRTASVTPNPASKTYGDADPAFTGTLTNFVASDSITAAYSRTLGETVAASPYTISTVLSPAGVLDNYTITYNTANFSINKRLASVTPNATSKTYGDADPALTGTLTNFVAGDSITATYNRTAGESVAGSPYTISAVLSPAAALANYTITYNTASFTINKRLASVTPAAVSKTYGDADPALSGTLSNFVVADGVTAVYSRVAGETVATSPYTISAVLSPAGVLANYNITYNTANFTIIPKPVTPSITSIDKTYDGGTSATLANCTVAVKVGSDDVACTSATVTFASANANASPQVVTATSITLTGTTANNYSLTTTTATTTATINPKPATWTTNPNSKTYGDLDPVPLTTGIGSGFLAADGVMAAYSRAAGETVLSGPYHITATLSATGLLSNYTITNAGANFTINVRPATWTTNSNSKTYGDLDPALLTTGSGTFLAADGVTAAYSRAAGETVLDGPYHITATLSPAGVLSNYSITNAGANFSITPRPTTTTLASSLYMSVTPVRADLLATVSSGVPIPMGTVTFTDSMLGPLGTVGLSATGTAALSTTALGAGQHLITATYTPSPNFIASASGANTAPAVTITAPAMGSLNPVNSPFTFSATLSDAMGYTPIATAAWSFDGVSTVAGTVTESGGSGTVSKSYSFAAAGIYAVRLTVNDNAGGITITNTVNSDPAFVVVYDPNGGFVTGGGWINSPLGAYALDPTLTGKATFGFVSKYLKGATIPTGDTEFQFKAGNLNFKSTSYEWLVIAGARAQYKGSGTINGTGNYGFMLTAIDGDVNGGGGTDKFRIKIWDKNNGDMIVYDNQYGQTDDSSAGTALGGGSIVIHK
jgi:MBG domain (YGX type)/YDG domain/Bacterial Ig-like domain (group 3)